MQLGYTSIHSFRSPLPIEECLRRLREETSIDSPVLPIGGWKPLAINKYMMRKVKEQQFEMYKTLGTPYRSSPWVIQGELSGDGKDTIITCYYGSGRATKIVVGMTFILVLFIIAIAVYRAIGEQLTTSWLLANSFIVVVPLVYIVALVGLPARFHARLEAEYNAAIEQLFEAEELPAHSV